MTHHELDAETQQQVLYKEDAVRCFVALAEEEKKYWHIDLNRDKKLIIRCINKGQVLDKKV